MPDQDNWCAFHQVPMPALVFKTGPEGAPHQPVLVLSCNATTNIDAIIGTNRERKVPGDLTEDFKEQVYRFAGKLVLISHIEYLCGTESRFSFAPDCRKCAENVLEATAGYQALVGDPTETLPENFTYSRLQPGLRRCDRLRK